MKLNTTALPIETSVQNATQAFSIKTTAKAFKILSDGLYKNKILAFVRELGRNAYDAHIAAGRKNVPFEIHLPNMLEPWFHVKDFGTGLSHENVLHLYTTYFESTKQDSNDFVGALGLGSKSPFSYVTSFTVKSRYDGVENIYTCFLSEAGVPSIVKMGEGKYTGHPGLEIVIPVEKSDFSAVKNAVNQDLCFWEGTVPNVVGDSLFKLAPMPRVITGKGWYTTGSRNLHSMSPVAVQGNVGYPVSLELLRNKAKTDAERAGLDIVKRLNPVVSFEIGKLDVTASREELSYDEPTIRNLIEAFVKIVDEFSDKFKIELDDVIKETTELSFRIKASELIKRYSTAYGGEFIRFFSAKFPKIVWGTKSYTLNELTESTKNFFVEGISPISIVHVNVRWRGNKERVKKDPEGKVLIFSESKNVTLENVERFFKNDSSYGTYRQVGWWDTTRKVLPRRQREAMQSYESGFQQLASAGNKKSKPSTFTHWSFNIFGNNYNGGKTVIFLNDQQAFGYEIVTQYIAENKQDSVYVMDYNKRVITPKQVMEFVKKFTAQLSGLKILSTSQLVLKTPVVKKPRAARTIGPARNVSEVAKFNDRGLGKHKQSYSAKSLAYSHYETRFDFEMERPWAGCEHAEVDFATGDFYYFYELRNKMYLDEKYECRVDASNYLNALTFFSIIPPGASVVGLKPIHIKKILKTKKKGKLIPISELNKVLLDKAMANPLLSKAYVISNANVLGSNLEGPIGELIQHNELVKKLNTTYGDLGSGKTGNLLFDELAPVFEAYGVTANEGLRKVVTVLEMIRYFRDGSDRNFTDAWKTLFKDKDLKNETTKLTNSIKDTVNAFYNKYPMLRFMSVSDFRYSNNKMQKFEEVINYMVEYVNFKNGKKQR